ncbi:helix-turn-helix domain-containing protein [Halopseudomonas sp.]|uniref:helix-turn-helix domain-containing protein n=1 Tax=Halopseudomonas sp. TaxID=2901191 RepID=UPI0039E2447C
MIEAGWASGMPQSGIAKRTDAHPSTVSREVRRKSYAGRYKAEQAGNQCDDRRANARKYCKTRAWLTQRCSPSGNV